MDKPLIVFRQEYTDIGGWGAISNFLTKFRENIPMQDTDVSAVSSCVLKGKGMRDNFFLIKEIERNKDNFLGIRKPQKIYAAKESYDYVFLVSVSYEDLQDVVDLQNFYLIHNACNQQRIIISKS